MCVDWKYVKAHAHTHNAHKICDTNILFTVICFLMNKMSLYLKIQNWCLFLSSGPPLHLLINDKYILIT